MPITFYNSFIDTSHFLSLPLPKQDEGEEDAAAEDGGGVEAKLSTPEELALIMHKMKQRQIQQETFTDTLCDSGNAQALHVPGVAGSAHNGVHCIGGIFGVGGFLGPDYPIRPDKSERLQLGPACTCSSCTGSPPVCTGCTCRR